MAKPMCRLCTVNPLKTDDELRTTTCASCTAKLGLTPMPEPMRPPNACTRCGTFKFVRVVPRHVSPPVNRGLVATMTNSDLTLTPTGVTYELDRRTTPYGGALIPDCKPALDQPRGKLSLYICTGCGFTETYCDDPASIPIGPEYMTDVVDYTAMQR